MTKRIIDNKEIDLTETEHKMYLDICASYDAPRFNGKDLFKGLFETNNKGLITMVRPPSANQSSLEVVLFLMILMINQHLRHSVEIHDALAEEMRSELAAIKEERAELRKILDEAKNK